MNILRACADPKIFGPWFRRPETWDAWFAFLAALFGLPMSDTQANAYRRFTGRTALPTSPSSEAWLVIGRRGGKSFVMALVAVYLATFRRYRQHLSPGERATILVLAADRRQARVILRYVAAMLTRIPLLAKMIERETAEAFDLTNSVTIEVGTASFRSTRGYTYAAVLADEIAFWPTDDAAEPDYAILDAIRPGMATLPGAMLLCASSPHARRGALWDAHRRHFGVDGAPLVWQAATREMNATVPQRVVDEAMERDPSSAAAEFGAQFRSDIEAFVRREVVEGCVSTGCHERPCDPRLDYRAFVDPSGGSADSMTLALGHRLDDGVVVIDAVRERRPPFSPEGVVAEFCDLLLFYGITAVVGDRYGGEWPREQFRKRGIEYELAEKPRSDLYRDMLPLLNSGLIDLLDEGRLVSQLVGLERRTARGGRDSIDHAPGGHDDLANAVAGCASLLAEAPSAGPAMMVGTGWGDPDPPPGPISSVFDGLDYLRRNPNRW